MWMFVTVVGKNFQLFLKLGTVMQKWKIWELYGLSNGNKFVLLFSKYFFHYLPKYDKIWNLIDFSKKTSKATMGDMVRISNFEKFEKIKVDLKVAINTNLLVFFNKL